MAVAAILADLGSDHETVCAGLLHDVLEDTACPAADREFGETITALVRSLGALDDPAWLPAEWVESIDHRLLTIKPADRAAGARCRRTGAAVTARSRCPEAGRSRMRRAGTWPWIGSAGFIST
ncbi:HD domain-containing protein [Nonomuraea cavernae]